MGVVYKAQDLRLHRLVALKFLPEQRWEDATAKIRFLHEARAASAINHQNIAAVFDIDEVDGKSFIAMEYVEGKTLKELAKEGLKLSQALEFVSQVAEGLSAAHRNGIVHRDIKSENIMVTKENMVKLMDFGLAKLKGASRLTDSKATLGTVAYMSPEQTKGELLDQRSDVFSLGVVLYELITGRLPFKGEQEAAVIYSICYENPEPLARYKSDVSPELQRIVDKALQKDKSLRYQTAADFLVDLRNEMKSLEYGKPAFPKPKKKLLPILLPAAILLAVLLYFFFRKDSEREASAAQNSLAVMYFENLADPEDRDKIAQMMTSLLITGLSESENLRVISRQRLYDILNLMGKGDVKVIDRKLASEVAKKAGVRWILTGEVLQTKPNLVVTGEVSEVGGGRVRASQRINAASNEDIFAVVDRLGWDLKKNLSLPVKAEAKQNKSVADVTTHSPEAYRYYLEGMDYFDKSYYPEAEKSFRKALEHDSTFAMAYSRLAEVAYSQRGYQSSPEAKAYLAQAIRYFDKAIWKEKHYIRYLEAALSMNNAEGINQLKKIVERDPQDKEAFYRLGLACALLATPDDNKEAVRYTLKAIEIDPLYKLAYNQLAYLYNEMGDFENSLLAINKYISLVPEEANPYDTRADLYAFNGKIDQAIESYKKALQLKPDFDVSLAKLGHMYLLKREYPKAESCYRALSAWNEKVVRSQGRFYLACVPLHQGKLEEALRVIDQGIGADRLEQLQGEWPFRKYWDKILIYEIKKDLKSAEEACLKGLEIAGTGSSFRPVAQRFYIQVLSGQSRIAEAKEIARSMEKELKKTDPGGTLPYWLGMGDIERAQGNYEAALANFRKAAEIWPTFRPRFEAARAYLEANRPAEAVAGFEKILASDPNLQVYHTLLSVERYYFLAQAYEKSGWRDKAIEKYEEFLDIWKNADPGIPEVEDAKQRLAKLKKKV